MPNSRDIVAAVILTAFAASTGAAGCKEKPKPKTDEEPATGHAAETPPGPRTRKTTRPDRRPVSNEIKQIKRGRIRVPSDHTKVDSPPLDLYFERYAGPKSANKPLIVLHGGPGNPMPMEIILKRSHLGRVLLTHYDIVYFEQRGTGRSLRPEEKKHTFIKKNINRYTMSQYVADLEAIRKRIFGPKRKITIMGSSWGGYLGLAYALAFPQNLERIILGSFEATARSTTNICANFDRALTTAEHEYPSLRPVMEAFRAAVKKGKVIVPGAQYKLKLRDFIEVASPFAVKARYRRLAGMLTLILKGNKRGLKFMQSLKLDGTTRVTMGGSLAARATYCEELVDKHLIAKLLEQPKPTLYCNNKAVLSALRKSCLSFSKNKKHFDVSRRLKQLQVPALVFAGRLDPLVPWQATASTAARMDHASFLLINGGHTPIKAGGRCFADAVNRFAQGKTSFDLTCFKQPTR